MGKKKLNLNNYTKVDNAEEATLVLVLFDKPDGTKQEPMFLKSKKSARPIMINPDEDKITWSPTVHISPLGEPLEYIDRIAWWFKKASKEYIESLESTYSELRDYDQHLKEAKHWLVNKSAYHTNTLGKYDCRKKDVGAFVNNWLRNQLERQDKRRWK